MKQILAAVLFLLAAACGSFEPKHDVTGLYDFEYWDADGAPDQFRPVLFTALSQSGHSVEGFTFLPYEGFTRIHGDYLSPTTMYLTVEATEHYRRFYLNVTANPDGTIEGRVFCAGFKYGYMRATKDTTLAAPPKNALTKGGGAEGWTPLPAQSECKEEP